MELLVVLVLIGLVAGLATPRLMGMYDSMSFALERDEVLDQIRRLPHQAFRQGVRMELTRWPLAREAEGDGSGEAADAKTSEARLPDDFRLPDGWSLEAVEPLQISARGICTHAAELRLIRGAFSETIRLLPPRCSVIQ